MIFPRYALKKRALSALLFIMSTCFIPPLSNAAVVDERIFEADPIPYIEVSINGVRCTLAIDPTFDKFIFLNPVVAEKTGLASPDYPGRIYKTSYDLEGRKIDGWGKIAKLYAFDKTVKAEAYWYERDIIEGFDGTIGIGLLQSKVVTFEFPRRESEERDHVFSSHKLKKKNFQWAIRSKSTKLLAKVNFHNEYASINRTVFNQLNDLGQVNLKDDFIFQEIALGFFLPAQRLELTPKELVFGHNFNIDELYLILKDGQMVEDASFKLKDQKLNEKQIEEIVVIGKSRKKKKKEDAVFFIGRSAFSSCENIQFDLKSKKVSLNCK